MYFFKHIVQVMVLLSVITNHHSTIRLVPVGLVEFVNIGYYDYIQFS